MIGRLLCLFGSHDWYHAKCCTSAGCRYCVRCGHRARVALSTTDGGDT